MKALILAAGKGERLRPLTNDIPKPMLEVAGKPILQHNVELLVRHGITDIAINLHHKGDVIVEYFGTGVSHGASIRYSPEEDLLGTAGALLPLERWLSGESFVVVYGDTHTTVNLTRMIEEHQANRAMVTLAVIEHENVSKYGIVHLGSHQQVVGFTEKPRHWEYLNAGMMVCEASVLGAIPHQTETRLGPIASDFGKDIIPKLVANGAPVYAYRMRHDERIVTIDTHADLILART